MRFKLNNYNIYLEETTKLTYLLNHINIILNTFVFIDTFESKIRTWKW